MDKLVSNLIKKNVQLRKDVKYLKETIEILIRQVRRKEAERIRQLLPK